MNTDSRCRAAMIVLRCEIDAAHQRHTWAIREQVRRWRWDHNLSLMEPWRFGMPFRPDPARPAASSQVRGRFPIFTWG